MRAEKRKGGFAARSGFTLIEVIAVLVLIGILSAVVFYVGGRDTDADLAAATASLRAHLRYAQTQAMNRNNLAAANPWGISCNGNQYWLFEGNVGQVRVLPDRDIAAGQVSLAQKGLRATVFTLLFDDRGIPYNGNLAAPLTDPLVITVTNNATGTARNITVTPLTGFVPAQ